MRKLKLVTILGTRPEIIRLSKLIPLLDKYAEHKVIHTGQNFSPELSQVFFDDLSLREPDIYLSSNQKSLGAQLGTILSEVEVYLTQFRPDGVIILGDTNSALSAIIVERLRIPVFHLEAGNRSFDREVPEELNRKLVDHVSTYNLCYTETARQNLLAEGLHQNNICLTGSPLGEVIGGLTDAISSSLATSSLGLNPGTFFLVSAHRQETVDDQDRLTKLLDSLLRLRSEFGQRIVVSTHPRTRSKLENLRLDLNGIELFPPFGYVEYLRLQVDSRLVLSDSGSLSEEASILGFRAATIRNSFERQEGLDVGLLPTVGLDFEAWRQVIEFIESDLPRPQLPGYSSVEFSRVTLNFVFAKLLPRWIDNQGLGSRS